MKTFIDILAKDKSAEVRASLAENDELSEELLTILAEDKHKIVRGIVASRPDLPKYIVDKLLDDKEESVLEKLIEKQKLSEAQLELFIQSKSLSIKRSLASNPYITKKIIEKIIDDNHVVNYLVFNPSISKDIQTILADRIISSEYEFMHEELAEKLVSIPKHIWKKFIDENNENVCRSLASNPNLNETEIEILAKNKSDSVRARIASRKNLSKKICELLSTDSSEDVLYELAKNTSLEDSSILISLAKRTEFPYVVTMSLRNPQIDLVKIPSILDSKDEDVLCHVAINPSIPLKWINSLLLKGDFVKRAIGRNPTTPIKTLLELSCHQDANVRTTVASNINSTSDLLEKLSDDPNESVRFLVACNQNCPMNVLDHLSTDEDLLVRQAVAGNLNTSDSTRIKLTKDKNKDVRIILANPKRFEFPIFVDNP